MKYRIVGDVIFHDDEELDIDRLVNEGILVAVEPEHQHQFLPWLTLPNGSSWTGCASCDWQYQYDH